MAFRAEGDVDERGARLQWSVVSLQCLNAEANCHQPSKIYVRIDSYSGPHASHPLAGQTAGRHSWGAHDRACMAARDGGEGWAGRGGDR